MTARADTADYRQLFLADTPMMDVRAPVEFAAGAFPGTVSLPLMTDEERAKVGTCYKQAGQAAALEGNSVQQQLIPLAAHSCLALRRKRHQQQ